MSNNQQIYDNKIINKLYIMYKEYKIRNKINSFMFLDKITKDEIIIIINLKTLQKVKIDETGLQFKTLIRCAKCINRNNHSNSDPFHSACKKHGAFCLLDKLVTDKKIQIIFNETQN